MHKLLSDITIETNINSVDNPENAVQTVLQLFFGALAGVAVLVIVIASLQFVLSRGNPDKAGKARNAIIYAAIGLALALMATAVLRFVVGSIR